MRIVEEHGFWPRSMVRPSIVSVIATPLNSRDELVRVHVAAHRRSVAPSKSVAWALRLHHGSSTWKGGCPRASAAAMSLRTTEEFLDAVVSSLGDVDVSAPVGCHPRGEIELAVAAAAGAPLGEEGAAPVRLLDAGVAAVGD